MRATLPPGPVRPADRASLASLIAAAVEALRLKLIQVPVETELRLAFRVESGPTPGIVGELLPFSQYRCNEVWDAVAKHWRTPELEELASYLWERGMLRTEFTGPDPARPDWERRVNGELVHAPLRELLRMHCMSALARQHSAALWDIDPSDLVTVADAIAEVHADGRRSFVAVCPLMNVSWAFTGSRELSKGVRFVKWTDEERCVFLTRFHAQYLDEDLATAFSEGCLEMQFPAQEMGELVAREAVANLLDHIKWALMVATDSNDTFLESNTVVVGKDEYPYRALRREALLFDARPHTVTPVSEESVAQAGRLMARFDVARSQFPEMDDAVHFLGRSFTAALPRDSLVEATIGLERLLVPNGGETTFRFRTHGAALISAIVSGDLDRDLKKIYDARSSAAHGSLGAPQDVALAARARCFLAKALQAVLEFHDRNMLRETTIADSVARLVRDRVLQSL